MAGRDIERSAAWILKHRHMSSSWSSCRAQADVSESARPVGGTAIACAEAMAHRYTAESAEATRIVDPYKPIPTKGLDWNAVIVESKLFTLAIISVYLRPKQLADHATTMQ